MHAAVSARALAGFGGERDCFMISISKCSLPTDEGHRRDAIIAFLSAGLHQRLSTALAVDALAIAWRAVAAHGAAGQARLAGSVLAPHKTTATRSPSRGR